MKLWTRITLLKFRYKGNVVMRGKIGPGLRAQWWLRQKKFESLDPKSHDPAFEKGRGSKFHQKTLNSSSIEFSLFFYPENEIFKMYGFL